MSRIAIATDSNSGITQAQGRELGVFVLPMPFYINDELFLEDITLTQEQFYQRLAEDADVKTTQPAPGDVLAIPVETKKFGRIAAQAEEYEKQLGALNAKYDAEKNVWLEHIVGAVSEV